jgi:YggT family protein
VTSIICTLLWVAWAALISYVVLGWVVELGRLSWGHPIRSVYDFLGRGIQPVVRPIRDRLPPVRIGGVALDLSIIILFIGIVILQSIIC